jgi:Bacteriophage minor capsid protein
MSNLTAKKLALHIKTHATNQARIIPGRLPDMPNRVISVTLTSGAGFVMDGLFDAVGFTVTCRGAENNFGDAEAIAKEVDDILTGKFVDVKSMSFFLEDVYVDIISRTGGGPVQFPMTDSQSRFIFTCNYYAQVATDIGQVS